MSLLRSNHIKHLQAVALKFSHHGMLQLTITTKTFEVGFLLAPVDDSEMTRIIPALRIATGDSCTN